ncbi:Uncharacterised protein [Yersinia pseudotuberculosis]|uniref:hypothetical protein n=1 Tax=Yersinia pseudotuberculosis TaxID=633 RepID=UPI0005E5B28B|nr:hypothetical protein [Yersinia pseudotuberculosis]CNK92399.1 Uncharacterised protein [Yersinia pseudotuberculosis]
MDKSDLIAEQLTGDELSLQRLQAETQPGETITIDKELFKQLLQLVLDLPDLGSQLAAINVDTGSATAGEVVINLEPSVFLLRLSAALRTCG